MNNRANYSDKGDWCDEAAERELQRVQNQLLEEGFIIYNNDNMCWHLTKKGIKAAQKEMERYMFKPGLKYMIGIYWAHQFGVSVE